MEKGTIMPDMTTGILAVIFKAWVVVVGTILAFALAGELDNGWLKLTSRTVIAKFVASMTLGFLGGEFIIDYWNLHHWSSISQNFITFLCCVFGLMIIGGAYQVIQITLHNKTLSEVAEEVSKTYQAIVPPIGILQRRKSKGDGDDK